MTDKEKKGTGKGLVKIIAISAGHLFHDIYTSFLAPILPLLIEKFELTYAAAGLISVVLRVPSLFNAFIGAYAEKINLKHLVIVTPALTGLFMCLTGIAPSYAAVLACAFLTGVSSSFFHVPSPVILRRLAGNRTGAAMSLFQIGGESARTVGPMIVLSVVTAYELHGMLYLVAPGIFTSVMFYLTINDLIL